MNQLPISPVIGVPFSVAIGGYRATAGVFGVCSHPTAMRVYPSRIRYPSPKSASVVGSADLSAKLKFPRSPLLPRLTTSKNKTPFPRLGSLGRRTNRSDENSTMPFALRGALSRSTMPRLRGPSGSSEKKILPKHFS